MKPCQPAVGSEVFDTATRMLFGTAGLSTAEANQCLNQQPSVCVAVGSKLAEIKFSGFAPQLVGVWQLTIKVPDGLTGPAIPIRIVIGGANLSNIVSLAIN